MSVVNNITSYLYNMFQTTETVFYDFETTGLNPFKNKIIEYAFLRIDNDSITELVNPETKFEHKITSITGIYPEDLEDKNTIEIEINNIVDFLDKNRTQTYLVAHNNDGFDKWFLKENLSRYTDTSYTQYMYIDTLILAKMLLPDLRSYSLKNLCEKFNINPGNHRALGDTEALKSLYLELIEILGEHMRVTNEYLLERPEIVYKYIYE
jgi:DNA polymerase III subunit alpha, Gram-positive type